MISQTTRLAAVLAILATPSLADMTVEFREGAPKDRFVFRTDTGVCQDGPFRITLDLAGSAAGLIFDVTEQGANVTLAAGSQTWSGTFSDRSIAQVDLPDCQA